MTTLSEFARSLEPEKAFDVLAVARQLRATGKDIVELQIGDSPFPTTRSALATGIQAIQEGATHYCPSPGLPSFREAIAANYGREFGVAIGPENVVVGLGAKVFEQFFCEAFLNQDDSVLLFTPHFPTYEPNIARRRATPVLSPLRQANQFRPDLNDVEHFLRTAARPRAIFLNSPHNPTGGIATRDDLQGLAELIRGRDIAVLSDEPYCHMAWGEKHRPLLAEPGMLNQVLAAYTFSKSYSMSGWRLGYAVSSPIVVEAIARMVNTTVSCVPPFIQLAGQAALNYDAAERDETMQRFQSKVRLLVSQLRQNPEVQVLDPAGTFYVFPDVSRICRRLGIRSHGLAMYLLEAADHKFGVACLGGECFGQAGQGFLRFSCAESDDRILQAVAFLQEAAARTDRVERYLQANPLYRL